MEDKLHEFVSDRITVTWSKRRCIHAADCIRGLPEVFQPGQRPWIMPGKAQAEEVAVIVQRCPTGALHFTRRDGGPAEAVSGKNQLLVSRSGPLYVRGDIRIEAPDGTVLLRDTRAALCRCGTSKNIPLCDGGHWESEFRDRGDIPDGGLLGAQPATGGPLRVTASTNGPLLLEGPVEAISADGQVRRTGTRAELCRCGGSANKPFCDGSHERIGFKSE